MLSVPLNTPRSAIWMTQLSIAASTVPQTTRGSQTVISTPLSLMSGPTMSRVPLAVSAVAGAGCLAANRAGTLLKRAWASD